MGLLWIVAHLPERLIIPTIQLQSTVEPFHGTHCHRQWFYKLIKSEQEKPMKSKHTLTLILLHALVLSACSAKATATPSKEVSIEGVYTSIAMTLAVQSSAATSTQLPTSTATMIPLATPINIPTSASLVNMVSSNHDRDRILKMIRSYEHSLRLIGGRYCSTVPHE